MKKNVFFCIIQIMYRKSIHFLVLFLRRHLRAGYITEEGRAKYNQHPFPNPLLYPILFVYYII